MLTFLFIFNICIFIHAKIDPSPPHIDTSVSHHKQGLKFAIFYFQKIFHLSERQDIEDS